MQTLKKLTVYLQADVARALERDARQRGLPITRAAGDAIRQALLAELDPAAADTIKKRLERLEQRQIARTSETAIIKEAILLYVRVWLEHTPAPEETTLAVTHASAER